MPILMVLLLPLFFTGRSVFSGDVTVVSRCLVKVRSEKRAKLK